MSKKLFVGGLSWNTDDAGLRQAFEAHGTVTEAKVINDRDTGRSRGFGFVTMADGGDDAIAAMDGTQLDGRAIRVNEAQERSRGGGRGGRGGGGGGYGGNRGGGGGYGGGGGGYGGGGNRGGGGGGYGGGGGGGGRW